jgi:hypothetical protein
MHEAINVENMTKLYQLGNHQHSIYSLRKARPFPIPMAFSGAVMAKAGRFLLRYVYAAGCCLYLFTIGLIRDRLMIYQICEYFGWRSPDWLNRPHQLLPEISVSDLVSFDVEVRILEDRVSGNTSLLESAVINKLVKQSRAKRIFEIGTFDGRTTLSLAANGDETARIFTLDMPAHRLQNAKYEVCENEKRYIEKPVVGARFAGTKYESKITQLFGDSASFDFSSYLGTMDIVFIDGSHAHEYVLNDSEVAMKLLKKWHDYGGWDGVTNALNEYYVADERFSGLRSVKGTSIAILTVNGEH